MGGYFSYLMLELSTVFVIGAAGGSFANVAALAYPDFRKILIGRSACPTCHHRLSWYELIPLVSYVFQTGKCRSCNQKIAPSYFWIELVTGLLAVMAYLTVSPIWQWWQMLWLIFILLGWVIIFLHDWRTMYVPMIPLYLTALITFFLQWTLGTVALTNAVGAALIAFVFIALLRLVSTLIFKTEAMGSADAYVAALVGLLVGSPNIYLAVFASFLIGSIYGLIIVNRTGKKQRLTAKVPFAPALLLGGWVAMLWGTSIINWYLGSI